MKNTLESLKSHLRLSYIRLFTQFLTIALIMGWAATGMAQRLNWTPPAQDVYTQIGGASQREGLGVVSTNNQLLVAYTGNMPFDPQGDAYVYLGATNSLGPVFGITQVTVPGPQTVASLGNPGLAVSSDNSNVLAIGYVDGFGSLNYVVSQDGGSTWAGVFGCGQGLIGSAGVGYYNGSFYLGAMNNFSNTLFLCRFDQQGNYLGSQTYSNITGGFGPGFGVFNGTLYIGVQNFSSHNIDLYLSTDGVNFNYSGGAAGDQTSTIPSFAVHNNVLYVGFRTNDGDHKFLYKYSTDGINWTGNIDPHFTMGGPAGLTNATVPGAPNTLVNVFSQNDTGHYIYTSYSTN